MLQIEDVWDPIKGPTNISATQEYSPRIDAQKEAQPYQLRLMSESCHGPHSAHCKRRNIDKTCLFIHENTQVAHKGLLDQFMY